MASVRIRLLSQVCAPEPGVEQFDHSQLLFRRLLSPRWPKPREEVLQLERRRLRLRVTVRVGENHRHDPGPVIRALLGLLPAVDERGEMAGREPPEFILGEPQVEARDGPEREKIGRLAPLLSYAPAGKGLSACSAPSVADASGMASAYASLSAAMISPMFPG